MHSDDFDDEFERSTPTSGASSKVQEVSFRDAPESERDVYPGRPETMGRPVYRVGGRGAESLEWGAPPLQPRMSSILTPDGSTRRGTAAAIPVAENLFKEWMLAPTAILRDGGWAVVAGHIVYILVLESLALGCALSTGEWSIFFTPFALVGALVVPCAYALHITYAAARGGVTLPALPDDDFGWFMLTSLTRVSVLLGCTLVPALAMEAYGYTTAAWIALALGVTYAPMAWLMVCVHDSLMGAAPHIVVPGIAHRIGPYIPFVVATGFLLFSTRSASTIGPYDGTRLAMGAFVLAPVLLYTTFTLAHLLGRLYDHSPDDSLRSPDRADISITPRSASAADAVYGLLVLAIVTAAPMAATIHQLARQEVAHERALKETASARATDVTLEATNLVAKLLDELETAQEDAPSSDILHLGAHTYRECTQCHSPRGPTQSRAPKLGDFVFRTGGNRVSSLAIRARRNCTGLVRNLQRNRRVTDDQLEATIQYMIHHSRQ